MAVFLFTQPILVMAGCPCRKSGTVDFGAPETSGRSAASGETREDPPRKTHCWVGGVLLLKTQRWICFCPHSHLATCAPTAGAPAEGSPHSCPAHCGACLVYPMLGQSLVLSGRTKSLQVLIGLPEQNSLRSSKPRNFT